MPFVDAILEYDSLSIVGMGKNTGKTETLNYILRRLPESVVVALTSVGTDGELRDIVTGTKKPEISLRAGMLFATAEKYYARRKLTAEVLDVSGEYTAAGRVVTARVVTPGKVMISGPSSTTALARWMRSLAQYRADLIITDGALSRKSSASPALCQAMVLATGAAFSTSTESLIRETAYTAELIALPLAEAELRSAFDGLESGVWAVNSNGETISTGVVSSLSESLPAEEILREARAIYITGALTERLLNSLRKSEQLPEIVVDDFTKVFVSRASFGAWRRAGGKISVSRRSRLIAITVNPLAPNGRLLDSDYLIEKITQATGIPAYDVRNC